MGAARRWLVGKSARNLRDRVRVSMMGKRRDCRYARYCCLLMSQ